jgi:hypothetical protein
MSGGGAERRADRRLDADLPVTVRDGATTPGRLLNVSRGGAALRIDRAPLVDVGKEISFRVEAGPARNAVFNATLLAVSSRGQDAVHLLRVRFDKLGPAEQRFLATLMHDLVPGELRSTGLLPSLGNASEGFDEREIDAFFLALRGPGNDRK